MGLKKREVKYDYLRTLAVFAIIMVHAIPAETVNSKQWLFSAALTPVLLAFVGIYFMLSGLFLLQSGTENIKEFYWKRFCTIFIPFACYSGIYYWYYNSYLSLEPVPWYEQVANFFHALFTETIPMAPHLWFMYVIMALYLCAPFLARMFHAMTDRELKVFLGLILLIQGVRTYLPAFGFEVGPGLDDMIFKGWLIYFVLGYICKRLYRSISYLPFAILGAAGFGVTMFQKCVTPSFTPGIHDMALTMIAMSVSIFLFFELLGDVKIPVFMNIAGLISRYSYSVYLIHYLVLGQIVNEVTEKTVFRHYYVPGILFKTGLTFIISLAAAVLFDETVIKVLKKLAEAVWNRRTKRKRRYENGSENQL
ncbi:acyltransferase [Lacrimispora sp. JR3]|uniref:acyltransferase n=1 Tax=Lacrimispora sinapis TaxID=3111456 RepID=UPI00374A3C51